MAKKQSSKKRTQVKDLPKKEKKLGKGDMKKVKGGAVDAFIWFKSPGMDPPPQGEPPTKLPPTK